MRNGWLIMGGALSAGASLLHLACILGGPAWYRFLGAGERMARLAERGSLEPPLVTVFIAGVLAVWAAYGFSGAGLIPRLPFLRLILIAITAVYLLRAAALPLMLATMPGRSGTFLIWSSVIVLVFGLVHAVGVWRAWPRLS